LYFEEHFVSADAVSQLRGPVSLNGKKILNLGDPENNDDAVNLRTLKTEISQNNMMELTKYLRLVGFSEPTNDLTMSDKRITNLANPTRMRRLGDQGRPGKGRHCGQRKLAKVKEPPGKGKGRMEKYRDCVNFRNIQLRPLRPLPRLINNDHSIRLTDKMRHFSPILIINKQRNRKSPSSLRKYSSPLLTSHMWLNT